MLISKNNNNIYFTSTPLYRLNLTKIVNEAENGVAKGVFSKLNPKSELDIEAIKQIKESFTKIDANCPGQLLCRDFLNNSSDNIEYYALELSEKPTLAERIVGLAQIYPEKRNYLLPYLYVMPEFQKSNPNRTLKNAGKLLMSLIFNQVKNSRSTGLSFSSTNDNFYLKIFRDANIKLTGDSYFHRGKNYEFSKFFIDRDDFDTYQNYIKNKFGIDFLQKI